MKIIILEVGHLGTNCYIVFCSKTQEAVVIDPGGNSEEIVACLNREKLKVVGIINTHGHVDHIAANGKIQQATGAPVMIHPDDARLLTSPHSNLSMLIGASVAFTPADRLLKDGEVVKVGDIELSIVHTPGHTPGGICLRANNVLFSGDTLFAQSVGRTDFPGGCTSALIKSIQEKLMVLPDETKVLPGHGPETTIGWERVHNPFIQ